MPQGTSDQYRFPKQVVPILETIRNFYEGDPKLRALLNELEPYLWDRDVTLEDFLSNAPAIPSSGFDAMVIRGATADDDTRTYPTVFTAMAALDTAGFVDARIGVVGRNGIVVETANLAVLATLRAVDIVGVDGGSTLGIWSFWTQWDINTRTTTGTGSSFTWRLHNMYVYSGTGKTRFFDGSAVTVEAQQTVFDGTVSATSTTAPVIALGGEQLYNCSTFDVSPSLSFAVGTLFFWNVTNTLTIGGTMFHYGCYYEWTGTTTLTCTVSGTLVGTAKAVHLVGGTFGHTGAQVGSSETNALTIITNGANASVVVTGAGDQGGIGSVSVQVSSQANCYIDVQGLAVTVGAGTSNTTWPSQAHVGGTYAGTVDLTGPCSVAASAERAIIRGKGVGGSLDLVFNAAAGTALSTISATDFALLVGASRHPGRASSTQQGYAIDAGSARGVVVFVGSNDFPTADTNAGTTVTVIDENGAPVALHAATHLPGGTDALATAAGNTILPDAAAAVGVAASFSRSDHAHAIVADVAGAIAAGDSAAEGASTSFARADHRHSSPATWPPRKFTATIGDGASTTLTVTHSFGTKDVVDSLRDAGTEEKVVADTTTYNTNDVTYTFAVAPAASSLDAVVIG